VLFWLKKNLVHLYSWWSAFPCILDTDCSSMGDSYLCYPSHHLKSFGHSQPPLPPSRLVLDGRADDSIPRFRELNRQTLPESQGMSLLIPYLRACPRSHGSEDESCASYQRLVLDNYVGVNQAWTQSDRPRQYEKNHPDLRQLS
jgi:hypothetical protein